MQITKAIDQFQVIHRVIIYVTYVLSTSCGLQTYWSTLHQTDRRMRVLSENEIDALDVTCMACLAEQSKGTW